MGAAERIGTAMRENERTVLGIVRRATAEVGYFSSPRLLMRQPLWNALDRLVGRGVVRRVRRREAWWGVAYVPRRHR